MSDAPVPIYRPAETAKSFRQGEILSDIRRYRLDPTTVAGDGPSVIAVTYPFAVVITQDCDVTNQSRPEPGSDPQLPCILLAEATTAQQLRTKVKKTETWKLVSENREERYHFLEAVPRECDAAGEGLDELTLDFKRYLAVPTDELYALVDASRARRRCVLNSPYMEHLCNRFGAYLGRIALPQMHHSVPAEVKPG